MLRHKLQAPLVPENVFLCAMYARGVKAGTSWKKPHAGGGPQPDPMLDLTGPDRLKRVC